jgi:hypothetical protein
MADEIVWEEPPAKVAGGGAARVWEARMRALVDRPGAWAKVSSHPTPSTATSTAAQLRGGKKVGVDPSQMEITSRGCDVYARFSGDES